MELLVWMRIFWGSQDGLEDFRTSKSYFDSNLSQDQGESLKISGFQECPLKIGSSSVKGGSSGVEIRKGARITIIFTEETVIVFHAVRDPSSRLLKSACVTKGKRRDAFRPRPASGLVRDEDTWFGELEVGERGALGASAGDCSVGGGCMTTQDSGFWLDIRECVLGMNVANERLVAELNKEQEAFIANKHTEKGEAVAPWVGAPNEDILREECLSLSTVSNSSFPSPPPAEEGAASSQCGTRRDHDPRKNEADPRDQRNFLKSPPKEVDFPWDFEAVQPMAQATLALDPNLENMRFQLVPKVISEENFWRNYFYRVSVLRQSHELNTMANQAENNLNQSSAGTVDQAEVQVTTGQESSGSVMTGSNSALADSPGHEFVSDSMRVSDTDLEEVREGMKKLGMQPPKEEDWERELEAELKDYEVVTGNESSATAAPVRSSGTMDKEDWEKQIDELLANENEEDLK
ncbi:Synapse-associated protein of 47 kDa [Eufriesea mexicana]|nr:Synapse-associated protein of 47 kDa [Eufriesea mexicana]